MVVGYILGQQSVLSVYYLGQQSAMVVGVYYEFHVGCKQTLKEPLSVFFTKAIICLISLVLGLSRVCYHHSGFVHAPLT